MAFPDYLFIFPLQVVRELAASNEGVNHDVVSKLQFEKNTLHLYVIMELRKEVTDALCATLHRVALGKDLTIGKSGMTEGHNLKQSKVPIGFIVDEMGCWMPSGNGTSSCR